MALPKVELHCHLGGFATHGPDLARVRDAAENPRELRSPVIPNPPSGWPRPAKEVGLVEYMALGNAGGSTLLADPGCLRRHCELLYQHLVDQGIRYAEIRCSPANYAKGRSPWTVLHDVLDTFNRSMDAAMASGGPWCQVHLLIIATRRESGGFRTSIFRHLALAVSAADHGAWHEPEGSDVPVAPPSDATRHPAPCRVVGVDLAGFEDRDTRAHYFRQDFTSIHRCGLAVTVHAGENDDAEAIWSAVFDLNARRLGHALHLCDSEDLLRSVAARGIAVEMCPYANYQIRGYQPMPPAADGHSRPAYPLLDYLRQGVRVTVNTDNIGISAATLTDNLLFAAELCPGLTRMDLLRLQRHAIDAAFVSPVERANFAGTVAAAIPMPRG